MFLGSDGPNTIDGGVVLQAVISPLLCDVRGRNQALVAGHIGERAPSKSEYRKAKIKLYR